MSIDKEKKYEFRKRMRCVHKENIRDYSLTPMTDEVQIDDVEIVLPENCGVVAYHAARDFQDYLYTSMRVSAILRHELGKDPLSIVLSLSDNIEETYIIRIDDSILITAKDERGLAQALYCLEDRMNARKAPFLKKEEIRHTFLFSPRMVHSGYGLDEYPNEHLSSIAHSGMDAILVFVKGINLTPSGFMDFNDLIDRAAKYGIDVYAYSYLKSEKHPEDEGAQEFYDNLYGKLFENCPGFKGVILVGESVGFPSKDKNVSANAVRSTDGIPFRKPRPGWWPCFDYPQWLECVKKSVRKHKPDADIVFWTYNWGYVDEEARVELIKNLPTEISLMATFEMFESYKHGKITTTVADYSLAFAGPGNYFLSEAKVAKERGIRLYSMTNTGGLTWDIGTIPYEPMPYQWMKRYEGMREANEKYGLCGTMDSHHFGFFPSFIGDLAKQCFIRENNSLENNLKQVIKMHFGDKDVNKIEEAVRSFSNAISCYTPTDADQYGAFRCGPAYPLCLVKAIKPPSESFAHFGNCIMEVDYPADYSAHNALPCGRGMLPNIRIKGELELLNKMLDHMETGVKILKTLENPNKELLYLINLGEYITHCVITGIHAKEWYLVTSRLKSETERETVTELIGEAEKILLAEKDNAIATIPIVENDSRLGWEPSMDYIGDKEHIEWKLRHLEYVLDYELGCYKNGVGEKWNK